MTEIIETKTTGYDFKVKVTRTKRKPVEGSRYDDTTEYVLRLSGNTDSKEESEKQMNEALDKIKERLKTEMES